MSGMGLPPLPEPTLLDKAITQISPSWGMKRMRARASLALAGGYAGARYDRGGLKDWFAKLGSADSDSIGDLQTLRNRSRDLRRNAALAAGAFDTLSNAIVGTGLIPRPRIDRELLGLTEEQATKWEQQAARIFWWWAESTASDYTGRWDFFTQQNLVLTSYLEGGDLIVLRRRKTGPQRLLGLALQLYEADYVSNPDNQPDSDTLIAGVEFKDGEPVRFHFANRHPGDSRFRQDTKWTAVPVYGPESGERMLLHIMDPLRVGQTRGVPLLAPILELFKQLTRYTDAELMAAVVQSFFTVLIKHENEPNPTGFTSPIGTAASPTDIRLGYGLVADLNPGETAEMVESKRPSANFDPFVQAILAQAGAATGVPYEVLIKRFNSSYSASKAAFLELWRMVTRKRGLLVRQFCAPSYDWLIAEAVAAGHLSAPGFFENPLIRRAWCEASWTGAPAGEIDERTATESSILRINNLLSTIEDETTKLTGGDWEQNHKQQVKERQARRRDGLDAEPVAERIQTETTIAEPSGKPTRDPRNPGGPAPKAPLDEGGQKAGTSLARQELVAEGGAR